MRNLSLGDMVFLKVTPVKGVLSFGCLGKLSPCFIEPFKILDQICHDPIFEVLKTRTVTQKAKAKTDKNKIKEKKSTS